MIFIFKDDRIEKAALLQPLIAEAREKKLFLWNTTSDILLTPDELEAANKEGNYLWPPFWWRLADGLEKIERLQVNATGAQKALGDFIAKVIEYRGTIA